MIFADTMKTLLAMVFWMSVGGVLCLATFIYYLVDEIIKKK